MGGDVRCPMTISRWPHQRRNKPSFLYYLVCPTRENFCCEECLSGWRLFNDKYLDFLTLLGRTCQLSCWPGFNVQPLSGDTTKGQRQNWFERTADTRVAFATGPRYQKVGEGATRIASQNLDWIDDKGCGTEGLTEVRATVYQPKKISHYANLLHPWAERYHFL